MRPGALLQLEAGCPESPPVYPTCRREPPESQGAAPREELRPLAAPVGGTSGRAPPQLSAGGGCSLTRGTWRDLNNCAI